MIKKFSMLALAGLIALPVVASAGVGPQASDLDRKIQDLSSQLDQLKAQMAAQSEANAATSAKVGDLNNSVTSLGERAEDWDLAARFKLDGDFRARMDMYNADTVFGNELDNDTSFTNRFRLNMRVGVTENVDFKGRLAMYKAWGMQSAFQDDGGTMWPQFDGNSTRTPSDNALRVDRAFVNFNNLFGAPVWFSIGRRPTTDGNPSNIRMGSTERSGTPLIMDYPFDGISMGYAYKWGGDLGSGRVRVCYGRGFEDGLQYEGEPMEDMDFVGVSWDILKKEDRFLYAQSFLAANVVNYPNFQDPIIDSMFGGMSGMGNRVSVGNIQHTSAMYMDKMAGLNYFVAGGWSRTDPNENGMFNDYVGMMMGQVGPNQESQDGYHAHVGLRYDIDQAGLKLGAEWNYGSQYWIGMTPGHDDLYQSKIAARGNVYEVYGIYDLPMGEAISKYAKTFMRLGYQRYEYDYAGSNDWNMYAYDLNDATDLMKLGYLQDTVESADQVYLTLEATF
ncbi:MAG: DUF3373 domain-containing protein [Proteobacteria bacterium]|nr:DUF3373 domain-containing protein [Pseudomonadota bacterium]MBU1648576.1 DUF3373 domain-containing protein [Pseudomonadota bacterium]MBU1986525.1 DUF3373 domain-containing protein [Pseudomonadota bacterium]